MPRKRKFSKKRGKNSLYDVERSVLRVFRQQPEKLFSEKNIIRKMNGKVKSKTVRKAINNLIIRDKIEQEKKEGKYFYKNPVKNSMMRVYEGIVDMTRRGSAFIVCEELGRDIFVSSKKINKALDGDTVIVETFGSPQRRSPGRKNY